MMVIRLTNPSGSGGENGRPFPDQPLHLPLELRRRMGGMLFAQPGNSSSVIRRIVKAADAGLFQSSREELLCALVAARTLAPRDLDAQDALVQAFLDDALHVVVLIGNSPERSSEEPALFLAYRRSLAEAVHDWAIGRFNRQVAIALVFVVGSLDLGSVLTSGDSALFEELGIREPITEASWDRPNDDAAVEHPEFASGRYHAAIIEVRTDGGDTYRIALPATSDEEFMERMGGVFGD